MSIDTRAIRAEPHIEIGLLIEHSANQLVERWCERALREHPNAKRVHHDVLRNELLALLQTMGRSLSESGNTDPEQHCQVAGEHGEQRWDNGWSLAEVVRDYQLMQLVILEYLETTLHRALRYREIMAIGVFIDDAVAVSIQAYLASRETERHRVEREVNNCLREANQRKDEFIAVLAHELRNPLAPIQNSAQILQLTLANPAPTVAASLEVIDRQTKQLVRLVDDLLDLSRITQGRFELRRRALSLSTVIAQAAQMVEPLLKNRDHRLIISEPAEPIFLYADPDRLIQIIVNLLNNAAKYSDTQGTIALSCELEAGMAIIRVRDSGLGIPPDMLSRIFEMFTQLEGTRRLQEGGLGIGLTLVRRLVELHGGSIAAFSEGVGRGSEFVVHLPAQVTAPETSAPASASTLSPSSKCHLLIIEDNDDGRNSLARLLSILGHQIELAATGVQGIHVATATKPQVILIDIGLPDISGYDVAKQIRSQLGTKPFLVALTGFSDAEYLRRALDAGFDAHLTKPVELVELSRLLGSATKRNE